MPQPGFKAGPGDRKPRRDASSLARSAHFGLESWLHHDGVVNDLHIG